MEEKSTEGQEVELENDDHSHDEPQSSENEKVGNPEEPSSDKAPDNSPEDQKSNFSKKKLRELKEQKYSLISEVERVKAENEKLRLALENSSDDRFIDKATHAYKTLTDAKDRHSRAIEEQDPQAFTEALLNLISAQTAYDQINKQVEEIKKEVDAPPLKQNFDPAVIRFQAAAHDFISENPDINPNSPFYNIEKATEVSKYSTFVDNFLLEKGMGSHIGSPEYFEDIGSYIQNNFSKKKSIDQGPKSRPHVEGVRGGMGSAARVSQHPKNPYSLTQEEREFLQRNPSVSEKEYLKEKINLKKKGYM